MCPHRHLEQLGHRSCGMVLGSLSAHCMEKTGKTKDGRQNRDGQEQGWGGRAKQAIPRKPQKLTGLPSIHGLEPWHWLKCRLDLQEKQKSPRSSPQPWLPSPGSRLSLRDKEFLWIHFTCTLRTCHVSRLGQAHSSTILSNPQHDSGKCGCYLPPQWKLRLGLSVHIMEKAAPFSLGKTFFRHFLIHSISRSIGPWSGVYGACSVIFTHIKAILMLRRSLLLPGELMWMKPTTRLLLGQKGWKWTQGMASDPHLLPWKASVTQRRRESTLQGVPFTLQGAASVVWVERKMQPSFPEEPSFEMTAPRFPASCWFWENINLYKTEPSSWTQASWFSWPLWKTEALMKMFPSTSRIL